MEKRSTISELATVMALAKDRKKAMGRLTVGIKGNLRRTQDIRGGGDSACREVSHAGVTTAVGFSGA